MQFIKNVKRTSLLLLIDQACITIDISVKKKVCPADTTQ